MPKFIANTSKIINWDSIVRICMESKDGDHNTVTSVVERSEAEAEGELLNQYRSVINNWIDAGYNLTEIEWYDYYPGKHFDIAVQEKIAELVNCIPRRVWVSEVKPGKIVPWHWDVEDYEAEWLAQGKLVRFVIFMQHPQAGHLLPLGDQCFYNIPQGDMWKWDDYKNWHAGINLGIISHYLFHFLGTPK